MQFFIDTADLDEIRDAQSMGLLDGITTNPSLVAKTGQAMESCIRAICDEVRVPVSAEVMAEDGEGMLREARELAAIAPNVVVKVPLTLDGLKVVRTLTEEGVQTNVTLCFSLVQAVLAAKAGATYISPFVGRLDDVGHDGLDLVASIAAAYDQYELDTQVLVASVRGPGHVRRAIEAGADVATIPHAVLGKLLEHPLTASGLERFKADAAKIPKP